MATKIKGPLTKRARQAFLRDFTQLVEKNYQKALRSGGVDPAELQKDDHTLLKAVTLISANQVRPNSQEGREMLENLEHFV